MEQTLHIINLMQQEGLFTAYAIGGGIAALFYIEPITTFDLDIFIMLPEPNGLLVSLSPLYAWLEKKGYSSQHEQVVIEGIPVQFIPAYNPLIEDAVKHAVTRPYGNVSTRVLGAEYLIAIMLQTYRGKDKDRLAKFMDEADISMSLLNPILEQYQLQDRFEQFRRAYYGANA